MCVCVCLCLCTYTCTHIYVKKTSLYKHTCTHTHPLTHTHFVATLPSDLVSPVARQHRSRQLTEISDWLVLHGDGCQPSPSYITRAETWKLRLNVTVRRRLTSVTCRTKVETDGMNSVDWLQWDLYSLKKNCAIWPRLGRKWIWPPLINQLLMFPPEPSHTHTHTH